MNSRQFYEQFWEGHAGELAMQLAIHRESRRPLLKLLARHLPESQPTRFLEVGCGTALDSCLVARARPQAVAVAIDLSEKAVRLAQEYAASLQSPVRAMAADLTALPFPAGCFDLVFSQGVLEHFPDPSAAVREQLRVLRTGGVLVVDVPQKYNFYTVRKHRAMRENRWDWGWETEYSFGELKRWAPQYGLEICGAAGHQHGRIVDRLLLHPHRFLRRKLAAGNGHAALASYRPGPVARFWEEACDWIDERLGPYLAINVAAAFRKGS